MDTTKENELTTLAGCYHDNLTLLSDGNALCTSCGKTLPTINAKTTASEELEKRIIAKERARLRALFEKKKDRSFMNDTEKWTYEETINDCLSELDTGKENHEERN